MKFIRIPVKLELFGSSRVFSETIGKRTANTTSDPSNAGTCPLIHYWQGFLMEIALFTHSTQMTWARSVDTDQDSEAKPDSMKKAWIPIKISIKIHVRHALRLFLDTCECLLKENMLNKYINGNQQQMKQKEIQLLHWSLWSFELTHLLMCAYARKQCPLKRSPSSTCIYIVNDTMSFSIVFSHDQSKQYSNEIVYTFSDGYPKLT